MLWRPVCRMALGTQAEGAQGQHTSGIAAREGYKITGKRRTVCGTAVLGVRGQKVRPIRPAQQYISAPPKPLCWGKGRLGSAKWGGNGRCSKAPIGPTGPRFFAKERGSRCFVPGWLRGWDCARNPFLASISMEEETASLFSWLFLRKGYALSLIHI